MPTQMIIFRIWILCCNDASESRFAMLCVLIFSMVSFWMFHLSDGTRRIPR